MSWPPGDAIKTFESPIHSVVRLLREKVGFNLES